MQPGMGVPAIVRIRTPKIKVPATQHVIVENAALVCVWTAIKEAICSSSDQCICPFTVLGLHKKWTQALRVLHLDHPFAVEGTSLLTRLTPAGMRAAGATLDFLEKENLDRLLWRGRWKSLPVLKHYVQLGVYHLSSLKLGDQAVIALEAYGSVFGRFMEDLGRP